MDVTPWGGIQFMYPTSVSSCFYTTDVSIFQIMVTSVEYSQNIPCFCTMWIHYQLWYKKYVWMLLYMTFSFLLRFLVRRHQVMVLTYWSLCWWRDRNHFLVLADLLKFPALHLISKKLSRLWWIHTLTWARPRKHLQPICRFSYVIVSRLSVYHNSWSYLEPLQWLALSQPMKASHGGQCRGLIFPCSLPVIHWTDMLWKSR